MISGWIFKRDLFEEEPHGTHSSGAIHVIEIAALAEKDKEIERLRTTISDWQNGAELNETYIRLDEKLTAANEMIQRMEEALKFYRSHADCRSNGSSWAKCRCSFCANEQLHHEVFAQLAEYRNKL